MLPMPHLLIRDRPASRLLEARVPTAPSGSTLSGPCTQMLRHLSQVDRNLRRQIIGFSGLGLTMVVAGSMVSSQVGSKPHRLLESETETCPPSMVLRVSDRQCYSLQGE